jgi:hypothetical protein
VRICMYICARERERKRQTIDGCHINSGNRCIVPTESESQTINDKERTNAQDMNIIAT